MPTILILRRRFGARLEGEPPRQPFILVANLEAKDGGKAIVAGNERVIAARLADAKFFFDQDRKVMLRDRVPKLKEIIFHEKLGSQYDRVQRVWRLAREIAPLVGADPDLAERAAILSKADLVSGMVGEFPELQGVMGRYYALDQEENPTVADAIAAHYKPLGPSDEVPREPVAIAVALADKLDMLVGFWAIDEKPTGSKDPYALRRAALGVIRIVLENGIRLRLSALRQAVSASYRECGSTITLAEAGDGESCFQSARLLRRPAQGASEGTGRAARSGRRRVRAGRRRPAHDRQPRRGARSLPRHRGRRQSPRSAPSAPSTSCASRRRRTACTYDQAPDPNLLKRPEEKALAKAVDEVEQEAAASAVASEDFEAAMAEMAKLRAPVDDFFDFVTVNTQEPGLRENRLRLLNRIRATTLTVADFSKIEG